MRPVCKTRYATVWVRMKIQISDTVAVMNKHYSLFHENYTQCRTNRHFTPTRNKQILELLSFISASLQVFKESHLHGLDNAESGLVRNGGAYLRELDVNYVAKFSLCVIGDTYSDDVTLDFSPLQHEKTTSVSEDVKS